MNAKVFGIIALVVAIVSIFIPIAGIYLPILGAILAIFSAGEGFILGASSIGINLINIIFLSPLLWLASGVEQFQNQALAQAGMASEAGNSVTGFGLFMVFIQIAAGIALFMKNKRMKAIKSSNNS